MTPKPPKSKATKGDKIAFLEAENRMLREQFKQVDTYMKQYELLSGFTKETILKPHYLSSEELHIFNNKGLEAFYIYLRGKMDALDEERTKKFDFELLVK